MRLFSVNRRSRFLIWEISLLLAASTAVQAVTDYRAAGHDHYFNLEYDQAIAAYRKLIEENPKDLLAYNHLATAILFKELLRLGMLETSAFKEDNQFLKQEKPNPDPKVKEEFEEVLFKGRELAESALEESPTDTMALFALSNNYGLQANYQFMIEKSYFGALRNGGRARKYSKELLKHHPDFVDAYLVAGVHEYVIGSLPWAVKVLVGMVGIRGNKKKGEEYVRRVAKEGDLSRNEARSLLSLLLRRERRPLEAAELLRSLLNDFPRNYVFHLELGAMYEDADMPQRALETFRSIRSKVASNEHRFGRMPGRAVEALERKIEKLEETVRTAANPPQVCAPLAIPAPAV